MKNITNELTAADVMNVAVKAVASTLSLPDLEKELLEAKVSGFPVVDDGQLVGVISRSDVVRQLCAERELAETTSDFYFDDIDFKETKMESFIDIADRVGERIEGLSVRDAMVRNPWTVHLNDSISDIARQFIAHRIHRLPVVEQGRLIGIVTTTDLVRLIDEKRLGQM